MFDSQVQDMYEAREVSKEDPVTGFRWWWLMQDGSLEGGKSRVTWAPYMEATCLINIHEAPQETCECGLYGRTHFDKLGVSLDDPDPLVAIGLIAGWGRVLVGRYHWKSQYARVVNLVEHVHPQRSSLAMAAEHYLGAVV